MRYLARGAMITLTTASFAADTHVVVGTQKLTWTYNGQSSTANPVKALVIDTLKKGDIVEIQVPAGPIPHGFITTKTSNAIVAETKEFVLACGEDPTSKPNAVLREVNCGAASNFAKTFTGTMRLEVLDTFKADTNFYCTVHKGRMSGTLKLKP